MNAPNPFRRARAAVALVALAVMAVACTSPSPGDPGPSVPVGPTGQTGAAAPPTEFPGPSNSGVPAGVTLTPYGGPCTITRAGTVIDARHVTCDLQIRARDVVIRRSKVDGYIDSGHEASLRIEESEVDAGTEQIPAVGYLNLTIVRSNIHGGQASVNCAGDCHIEDSWLHGQQLPDDADWHLDGFLSNGGSEMTLLHNTLSCDPPNNDADGGCTAGAALLGDFAPVTHVTFDRNLFTASTDQSYCLYAGTDSNKPYGRDAHHIVVTNNVFQRGSEGECGGYGPWTSFDPDAEGNVWSGNVWDDGSSLDAD